MIPNKKYFSLSHLFKTTAGGKCVVQKLLKKYLFIWHTSVNNKDSKIGW